MKKDGLSQAGVELVLSWKKDISYYATWLPLDEQLKYCLCDFQPSNIMVGLDGEVKIVDFGLVTAESDEEGNVLEKTMGTGTRSFMPPEQVRTPVL